MTALDLARLAPPSLSGFDYETALAARLARLRSMLGAAGIDYSVAELETDPAVILEEADAYREMLAYGHMDDAVRALLVAYASGSDLDHLGARFGVARHVIRPARGSDPAVLEADDDFRRRVVLAPERFAGAGTEEHYRFHALSAHAGVRAVDLAVDPLDRSVSCYVQSREPGELAEVVEAVRARLDRDDIRALTDVVNVVPAPVLTYPVEGVLYIRPGPDAGVVRSEAVAAVAAAAEARRYPGRDVSRSALISAASVGGVDRVVLSSPVSDLIAPAGLVLEPASIDLSVVLHEG